MLLQLLEKQYRRERFLKTLRTIRVKDLGMCVAEDIPEHMMCPLNAPQCIILLVRENVSLAGLISLRDARKGNRQITLLLITGGQLAVLMCPYSVPS